MKSEEPFEQLENLLASTNYTELTEEQLDWLTEHDVDEESYRQQASLLRMAKQQFTLAPPPANIRSHGFREALEAKRRVNKINTYGWIVSGLLVVVSFLLGRWSTAEQYPAVVPVPATLPTELIIRDTVYLEQAAKEIILPKIIYQDRIQRDTVYLNLPVAGRAQEEIPPSEVLSVTSSTEFSNLSRNAKETEALLKVLVEVY